MKDLEAGPTCSVCLQHVRPESKRIVKLKCGHLFHAACVEKWLQQRGTCPNCRNAVSPVPKSPPRPVRVVRQVAVAVESREDRSDNDVSVSSTQAAEAAWARGDDDGRGRRCWRGLKAACATKSCAFCLCVVFGILMTVGFCKMFEYDHLGEVTHVHKAWLAIGIVGAAPFALFLVFCVTALVLMALSEIFCSMINAFKSAYNSPAV